jgi:phosphohistidine phosphatase
LKRLTLVRHAQAESALAGQSDFERALTRRGTEDAAEMARRLKQRKVHIDLLLTSPAARTMATAEIFARTLKVPSDRIDTDERLYAAEVGDYLRVLQAVEASNRHVLVVGHNPGITEFADKLSGERRIDAMPTCSVATMQIAVDAWAKLGAMSAHDVDLDYPGRLS